MGEMTCIASVEIPNPGVSMKVTFIASSPVWRSSAGMVEALTMCILSNVGGMGSEDWISGEVRN